MFGGTNKSPRPGQKPFGVDSSHASTSEEARPVPWFAGKQRIGMTFISDVFRQRTVSVTQTLGKQKSKVGYNYFASFAAAACHGPVDGLHDIILNGESVYASSVKLQALTLTRVGGVATFTTKNPHGLFDGQGVIISGANEGDYNGIVSATVTSPTAFTFPVFGTPSTPATGKVVAKIQLDPIFREGDNSVFVDVTIPDYGNMRFYWGTQDQVVDPTLAEQSGVEHPPYRGVAYGVFDQLFLGFNQTNVPNLELVLSRTPRAAWHAFENIGDDANPVPAVMELLQHPAAGPGVLDGDLDTASLVESALALEAEGLGLSPLLTRQQSAGEFLIQALEYFDGFPQADDLGRLFIRLCRAPVGDLLELGDADLADFPRFNPEDWRAAFTAVDLKFTRAERGYKEDMVPHREPFLQAITGRPNVKTLDRPWITDLAVAQRSASSAGRVMAVPQNNGSAAVLRRGTMFEDLAPGSTFKFNVTGRDLRWQVFRVDERTDPGSDSADFSITFHADHSYLYEPPLHPPAVLGVGGEPLVAVGGGDIEGV